MATSCVSRAARNPAMDDIQVDVHADTNPIVNDVLEAFDCLARTNYNIVARFQAALTERSRIPGLCEANESSEGLAEVLAGLLGQIPDPDCDVNRNSEATGFAKSEKTQGGFRGAVRHFRIRRFQGRFREAVTKVAQENKLALQLMRKHERESGMSPAELLEQLLRHYVQNKSVYTY